MQPLRGWEGQQLPGRIQTAGKLPEPTECVQKAGDPMPFWCFQLGAYDVTGACTRNPAQPRRLGCMHQTCANVQSQRHDFLKSRLFASTSCSPFPIALLQPLKIDVIVVSSLPLVSLLPANSLKPLVWKAVLPARHREARRAAISVCSAEPRMGNLVLCSAFAGGFWAVLSDETWY